MTRSIDPDVPWFVMNTREEIAFRD